MVVSGFYDCVAALLKYRSYQKNLSDIALLRILKWISGRPFEIHNVAQ